MNKKGSSWSLLAMAAIGGILLVGVSGSRLKEHNPEYEEKQLVVLVPSYNNEKWCERNLTSLFDQHYHNYQLVYINDCSTDATLAAVKKIATQYKKTPLIISNNDWHTATQELQAALDKGEQCIVVDNQVRQGALCNLYHAIHACKDESIVATFDGDDWAKDNTVFAKVNQAYQDRNVWMTYGQYETWPEGFLGDCRPIEEWIAQENAYRECKWVTSHLRTFYAALFKKIKREDLMYGTAFFDVTWDQAFMFPMLEMCAGHYQYIPDVLYVYNQANPINDFKVRYQRQQFFAQFIRSKDKYSALEEVPIVAA